jgi:nitrite reductase/ring-hydroxylating ferredoxin subunit
MKRIYALESKRKIALVMNNDFVKVAATKDIQPSQMKEVEVAGEKVCVINVEGKFYAIDNVCTHEGGPLAEGTLEGYEVECPWHGSRFDVRTGEVINPPAETPQPLYEVKVEDNNILVRKKQQHNKRTLVTELETNDKIMRLNI